MRLFLPVSSWVRSIAILPITSPHLPLKSTMLSLILFSILSCVLGSCWYQFGLAADMSLLVCRSTSSLRQVSFSLEIVFFFLLSYLVSPTGKVQLSSLLLDLDDPETCSGEGYCSSVLITLLSSSDKFCLSPALFLISILLFTFLTASGCPHLIYTF